MFKSLIHKILHLGVGKKQEKTESQQLINFNSLLLFSAFILFLSLSTNVLDQSWTTYDNIVYIGGYSIIIAAYLLNYSGLFKVSCVFAHIAFSLVFCSAAIQSGGVFICCMINLVWMVISFRFTQSTKESIFYCSLQLLIVISTLFIVANSAYSHNENNFDPVVRSIVYALMFIFLFTTAKFFTDQIRKNVGKVSKLVDELELKNKKIEMAYHEMENFAHKISHDLKAPLRNMNTYATLLKKDIQKNKDENLEEYSDHIYTNGIKLTKMIDDVLAYSKLNASEDKDVEILDLKDVIQPIRKNMEQIYPDAEIKLLTSGKLYSSHTKLTMLMQNLIENGLKYNDNPKPTVSVNYVRQNGHYKIDIKDNGIGIPSEYQDQIFNLFSRLHSDQEYPGTGIGLSTCKKIVEEHLNGELSLQSSEREGSTFTIKCPSN